MDKVKHLCDAMAGCAAFVTVAGYLPVVLGTIAATLSIIWTSIQIYTWWRKRK